MKKILFLFGLVLFIALPIAVHGQTNATTETLVFDSTDHYLGACDFTDTSTWTLNQDLTVSKFSMWYKWQTGETELPITVTKDGAPFASFTAKRSACDSYQTSWCNADYVINKTFPAGTYTTTIANAYQCLKPGGTGTVLLYSLEEAVTDTNTEPNLVAIANSNTNTSVNLNSTVTNTDTALNTNVANVNVTMDDEDENDSSDILTYVLIGILAILIVVIIVMYLKCCKKSAIK